MEYQITEGIESTWHYHLSPVGKDARGWQGCVQGLCGARTMLTLLPLDQWGTVSPSARAVLREVC